MTQKIHCLALLIITAFTLPALSLTIDSPKVLLKGIATDVTISGLAPGENVSLNGSGIELTARANAEGNAVFVDVLNDAGGTLAASAGEKTAELRTISGWLSILPPLIAVFLALTIRNVIPALFAGIWVGAITLLGFTPLSILTGMLNSFEVYVTRALSDTSHAQIILFSLMIGGMVGIITRSNGMTAIVNAVIKRAKSVVSGQVAVWAMGLVIFFDDYSNTLVVGNTARPITDKLKISREKLAYIVDSTAAPVATIALITTWVGYQLGLIDEAVSLLPDYDAPAYSIFLSSIPYSFYPILALAFVLIVALTGRDFGPMYTAEARARNGKVAPVSSTNSDQAGNDELVPKPDVEPRAIIAVLPILVLVGGLLIGLYVTGKTDDIHTLQEIVGNADSYKSLMWASICSVFVASSLAIGFRALSVHETVDAWYTGVRAMFLAMIILVLAWALSYVTKDLGTAEYLVSILGDTLPLALVPAAIFVISGLTAFSTGTSWGTMGILMPLIIPLTWAIMSTNGAADPAHMHILYSAVACNLAGAVWGDHCSPISDTTVLSSIASGCDHIEHVRTQLPYALLVGVVALVFGIIPVGYGMPWWIALVAGTGILITWMRFVGKKAQADTGV